MRTLTIDWLDTGLVGTIAVEIRDAADGVLRARSTSGITENPAGSGIYATQVPEEWTGRAIWDANGETFDDDFTALVSSPIPPETIYSGPKQYNNSFEYVPVFVPSTAGVVIKIAAIRNLSTVGPGAGPGYGSTDRGRMFGQIVVTGGNSKISLYSDAARSIEIVSATVANSNLDGRWIDLATGANGHHEESARISVNGQPSSTLKFVCFPSFADDSDVSPDPAFVAALPGYDTGDFDDNPDVISARGLAFFHAKAVKQILTTSLPSVMPNLFGGSGLSSLIPMDESEVALPDLTKIVNVDALRELQAALVTYLSANTQRHQREFADIADAANERFRAILADLAAANAPDEEDAAEVANDTEAGGGGGVSFGSFNRG